MAKSRKRTAGRQKTAKQAPAKATPATREKKPRTEVEIVEGDEGPGWETGVALLTGFLILVAILIVDYGLGKNYGEGVFF